MLGRTAQPIKLDIIDLKGKCWQQSGSLQELYKCDPHGSDTASQPVFVLACMLDPPQAGLKAATAETGIRRVFIAPCHCRGSHRWSDFDVLCLGGGPRCREYCKKISVLKEPSHDYCNKIKPTGLAIVACSNPLLERLLDSVDVPALTVAVEQPAEVSATVVATSLFGQTVLIRAGQEATVLQLRIVGRDTSWEHS